MKTSLSVPLSTKALLEQEYNAASSTDSFADKIGRLSGHGSKGINIIKWYERVAFDILGEIPFGESFHRIENG